MRTITATVLAGAALALVASGYEASAQDKKSYAMVFQVINNAFVPPLQQGCADAAKELGVECTFMGPPEFDEAAQLRMVQDMVQRGVTGIATSAANPKSMARALKQAQDAGIPVVLFNGDVLPEDQALRLTFIGTDNYSLGAQLAQKVLDAGKKGGTVCIQSGAPSSINLNDRVQGARDVLAGTTRDKPVERLTGQNGWTEPAGCPVYNNDDVRLAVQQFADVLGANPDLGAFVAVGGWAQYAPQAYRQAVDTQRARVDAKDLVLSFGDNFEPQMPLLREGYSHFNIGQRPYDMAYTAIKVLNDFVTTGAKPEPRIVTGLETCTRENVDACGKLAAK